MRIYFYVYKYSVFSLGHPLCNEADIQFDSFINTYYYFSDRDRVTTYELEFWGTKLTVHKQNMTLK